MDTRRRGRVVPGQDVSSQYRQRKALIALAEVVVDLSDDAVDAIAGVGRRLQVLFGRSGAWNVRSGPWIERDEFLDHRIGRARKIGCCRHESEAGNADV